MVDDKKMDLVRPSVKKTNWICQLSDLRREESYSKMRLRDVEVMKIESIIKY